VFVFFIWGKTDDNDGSLSLSLSRAQFVSSFICFEIILQQSYTYKLGKNAELQVSKNKQNLLWVRKYYRIAIIEFHHERKLYHTLLHRLQLK
jgi:hypothetical protein